MTDLKIALFQSDLLWENRVGNLNRIEQDLNHIQPNTLDLIVFPEMFTTGFSMTPSGLAESMDGETVDWMLRQANRLGAVIAGSLIIKESEQHFNRLIFAYPDGQLAHYDKRHLFTFAGEHKEYQAGKERKVVDVKGWKVCPMICYDLRFPAWSRNNLDYDLLLYVANWPAPRHQAWRNLLVARAIENQCYVVGVNRWGTDENGHQYSGGSTIIDFAGDRLLEMTTEGSRSMSIQSSPMYDFRKKLNFLADQDEISIAL